MTSSYYCFDCKNSSDSLETLHDTRFCSVSMDKLRSELLENGREKVFQDRLRGWYKGQGDACMCLGDCPKCNFHSCSGCLCGMSRFVEMLIEIDANH